MTIIQIKGVDVKLLEKQRLIINKALSREDRDFGTLLLDKKEVSALMGISNMLDVWSDGEYWNKQDEVNCKFCQKQINAATAHLHDGGYVGECCWDERLRATE